MSKTRILHISDPQFGHLCYAQPTDPSRPESIVQHALVDAFLEHASSFSRPGLVVISGDLTSAASPYEYKQHDAFCDALQSAWGEPVVPVFCVAGNHDVSWPICKIRADASSNRRSAGDDDLHYADLRFAPYLRSQTVSAQRTFPRKISSAVAPGEFVHRLHVPDEILVVGLNTAVEDTPDTVPHHGVISDRQLELANAEFSGSTNGEVRVLVLHHHLTMMTVPPSWNDYSAAQSAESLLKRLSEWKVDLVLHGHKHHPNHKVELDAGWHSQIFSAGSLATVAEERMGGFIRHCAHEIEILGRNPNGFVYGERRTHTAGGGGGAYRWASVTVWEKDPDHDHNLYAPFRFGVPVTIPEAATVIEGFISRDPRGVGQLIADEPSLFGINHHKLIQLVQERASSTSLTLVNHSGPIPTWKVV